MDQVTKEIDCVVKELKSIKQELHEIREGTGKMTSEEDFQMLRQRLGRIDAKRFKGMFDFGGKLYEIGHRIADELIDECQYLVGIVLAKKDNYKVSVELRPLHDRLEQILMCLKEMKAKENYSVHDLLPFRRFLGDMEVLYHDGGFDMSANPEDHSPNYPEGQAIVCGLFNECHRLIRAMLLETPMYAISDDLMPLYDSLCSLNTALGDIDSGKVKYQKKDLEKYHRRIQQINRKFLASVKNEPKDGLTLVANQLEKAHDHFRAIETGLV